MTGPKPIAAGELLDQAFPKTKGYALSCIRDAMVGWMADAPTFYPVEGRTLESEHERLISYLGEMESEGESAELITEIREKLEAIMHAFSAGNPDDGHKRIDDLSAFLFNVKGPRHGQTKRGLNRHEL